MLSSSILKGRRCADNSPNFPFQLLLKVLIQISQVMGQTLIEMVKAFLE